MDTGGKVATGILVPLAVVGAAVGGYFIIRSMGKGGKKDELKIEIPKFNLAPMGQGVRYGGKRRRTHRRRR